MIGRERSIWTGAGGAVGKPWAGREQTRPWMSLVVAVGAGVAILAVLWAAVDTAASAGGAGRLDDPQCAAMARVVAGRSHSMFDGQRFRATERRAYGVCIADPTAFRRLIRDF